MTNTCSVIPFFSKSLKAALPWLSIVALLAVPARSELFSVSASGRINTNNSLDTTIPIGTPWTFEVIYDTAAPDRDFVLSGIPDPTFGRFTNEDSIPALHFFHYKAGDYEVTLDDPSDFGPFSGIIITFGGVHAIDINLNSPGLFPPLGGGAVSFHADFNDLSNSILTSDALPTNTAIDVNSFQDGSVTLLPQTGGVVLGSSREMTSLTIAAVPEPSACALATIGLGVLSRMRRRKTAPSFDRFAN